ncbi:MAG: molybdopterin-dependent oxidoreductase, partial [Candidatus Binatia bacterium]
MPGVKSNDTWLSRVVPFGLIGQTKPQHYREMLGVIWENRKEIPYAWNVLNHGVCDGCSLGPYGLRDNVLDGVHLCMTRLKLLKLNTMAALDLSALNDVGRLRRMEPEQLRSLGRLSHPMVRGKGQRGFLRVTWEEALDAVCKSIRKTAPHELAFFATSRGLTNEVYYVFQKLARVLGTNNVDLCSRLGHAASVSGLKATLGYGASTCSLADFIGTDLLVIFGSDLADNQPVTIKYMHYAKKAGTRIVVVNPVSDYGFERYRAPSVASSAVFGAKLMDDLFEVRVGGDTAFINGVLKFLILAERIDRSFVDRHTTGFAELEAALEAQSWDMLEQRSGVAREAMQKFAEAYSQARTAVFVYSMGLTQHELGGDNVKVVVNLALARGMLGREKCGVMPIRCQSSVQGGGECGSEPDKFPGGFAVNDDT